MHWGSRCSSRHPTRQQCLVPPSRTFEYPPSPYDQTLVYIAVSFTLSDRLKGVGLHASSHHLDGMGRGSTQDSSTAVRVPVLLAREIETKTSGQAYAGAQSAHCVDGKEAYVTRRHICALAGSDNSRVVVSTSSHQRALPEYKALLLLYMREDSVVVAELTLTAYASSHCRSLSQPFSLHPSLLFMPRPQNHHT